MVGSRLLQLRKKRHIVQRIRVRLTDFDICFIFGIILLVQQYVT